jgi:metal-responsive CopG/Arc/MetJ family transcriptional regulator
METITIKMDSGLLNSMDQTMKGHNYSTRTEFIREAIRDKLEQMKKEELITEFMKFRGKARIKTTPEQNRITREQVSREMLKEFEEKFK